MLGVSSYPKIPSSIWLMILCTYYVRKPLHLPIQSVRRDCRSAGTIRRPMGRFQLPSQQLYRDDYNIPIIALHLHAPRRFSTWISSCRWPINNKVVKFTRDFWSKCRDWRGRDVRLWRILCGAWWEHNLCTKF